MVKTWASAICLGLFLTPSLIAQSKATKLRGSVHDLATKVPVAGATVSASGDTAQRSEVTDDDGFFRLLIEGVAPGDLVRIRVEKPGFVVYDRQVVASEEIPISILLRRLAGGSPKAVPKPVEPIDPVVDRHVQEMKDPHPFTQLNALKVLAEHAPTNEEAMRAVIAAALDSDYRVRLAAVNDIQQLRPGLKEAVTNLLIGLEDQEPAVREASIRALRAFPRDKDATGALFRILGAPPSINLNAMYSLIAAAADDPRLSEAELYAASIGNADGVASLIRKAPLSQELISRLIVELGKSLDSPINFRSQGIIEVLLKGGDLGRKALHQFLSSADPFHQSRLALSWLEEDHGAKGEILPLVEVAGITTELGKAMQSDASETVFLPHGEFPNREDAACKRGVMLRASMGILVLDLEPRGTAWNHLASLLFQNVQVGCGAYAVIVPRWIKPPAAKPITPILANLLCPQSGGVSIQPSWVADTLAMIGDESTIALMQKINSQQEFVCDALQPKPRADLTARIRSRLAAN
jgi:HEAT repeats